MTGRAGSSYDTTVTESHQLVVIRHSKAGPHTGVDFERELTERGRHDAAAAGRWLASQGITPSAALVSSAVRARQTWHGVATGAKWTVEPSYEQSLYSAEAYDVLELASLVDEAVGTLVVVGHNPTMHSFAATIDDGEGDPAASAELASGFPTSAVAVFDVPVPWADLAQGAGRLTGFHVGRG